MRVACCTTDPSPQQQSLVRPVNIEQKNRERQRQREERLRFRGPDKPLLPGKDGLMLPQSAGNGMIELIRSSMSEQFVEFSRVVNEHVLEIQTTQRDHLEKQREALNDHLSKIQLQTEGWAPAKAVTSESKFKEEFAAARGAVPNKDREVGVETQDGAGDGGLDARKVTHGASLVRREENQVLRDIFEMTEADEAQQQLVKQEGAFGHVRRDMETAIDAVVGVVILLNALFIGFSMDYAQKHYYVCLTLDIIFCAIFTLEILSKICLKGLCSHFCKKGGGASNLFDLCLVSIDFVQILTTMAFPDAARGLGDNPLTKFLRMVKILKLVRLTKLLKSPVFEDLVLMIKGLLGGIGTLVWAVVLFIVIIYIISLVFRELFGRTVEENVYEYFQSVPRSMFTMFRCSLGDCSSAGGVPIFEHVQIQYGGLYSMGYCIYIFFVTVGLFNVISAIFVEATMAAGRNIEHSKRKGRLSDQNLWATRITAVIKGLIDASPEHEVPEKMSAAVEEINGYEIPTQCLGEAVCNEGVAKALHDLDIDPEDNARLSDILDPDLGGTIAVRDLIDGLRRLRGEPKRSDIIAVDLMVRSMQGSLMQITESLQQISDDVQGMQASGGTSARL